MKKGILLSIVVLFLFSIMMIVFSNASSNQSDDKEDNIDTLADEESTLQGYYFHGYIDIREPFESFDEVSTYMYYMNNHLKDYLNQPFVQSQSQEDNEEYIRYFEQLDQPVNPVSFQNKYDLNDGEYVKVRFKGGIKETYPAQIGEIIDVEVIDFID